MRLECGEALEGTASDGISLHVADARLGLALGPRPVRTASAWRDAPVGAEGAERRVHVHDARLGVAPDDQRARIVDEHRLRDAAEVQERTGEPLAPVVVPLAQKRPHVDPSRIAQHGDEEVDAHLSAADDHAPLAEVDLKLMAGRRLEAHRRHLGGAACLAMRRDRPLHECATPPSIPRSRQKLRTTTALPAARRRTAHAPSLAASSSSARRSRPVLSLRLRATTPITLHGHERHAELAGNALTAPSHRLQRPDLPHQLWLDHRRLRACRGANLQLL